jgi:hypothetical protein
MDLSCELPKLSCLKKPTKTDIEKLKEANIVPTKLIDSIFKDLEKDYNIFKKKTKSKTRTRTANAMGANAMGANAMGGRRSLKHKKMRTRKMFGGELSKFQKDKITDMVILLVAGSSYWTVLPVIEAWIISIGILPKLCGQNMMEHISSNLFSSESQTCSARANRYNTIMTGFVAVITGSAWYQKNKFTKENLSNKYNKIHHYVKKKLFGRSETPTPPNTPTPSPEPEAGPATSTRKGETARSRLQEQQLQEEQAQSGRRSR